MKQYTQEEWWWICIHGDNETNIDRFRCYYTSKQKALKDWNKLQEVETKSTKCELIKITINEINNEIKETTAEKNIDQSQLDEIVLSGLLLQQTNLNNS